MLILIRFASRISKHFSQSERLYISAPMGKGAVSKRKAVGASHLRHPTVSASAATKQSMSQFRDVKADPSTGFRKKQKSIILAGLRALGAPAVSFPEHFSNLSFSFPHQKNDYRNTARTRLKPLAAFTQVIACLVTLLFAHQELPFSKSSALSHVECFCGDQSVTIGELEVPETHEGSI